MENDSLPQYMQIALSIAGRIAGGDVPEGAKISGRSKLSSEYNVSPETIRKAVRLLSDMRVVDVGRRAACMCFLRTMPDAICTMPGLKSTFLPSVSR